MRGKTILVVEDEGIEALDLQQRLCALGYNVPEIALSGEEAVTLAAKIRPDLVVVDIMLSGALDGIAAAQRIRESLDIPIIYLTAYADEATLQRAKITEPYGYIIKPFKERELHITIDVALYKHKFEKKLRESERWLYTILRSIGDAVIATDGQGRVSFMNPMAEALTGWTLGEAARQDLDAVFVVINRDTREPAANPVKNVLKVGKVQGMANSTILVAKDGTEVPIDNSASPIQDEQGNVVGAILVFRDITERERAQEELRNAYADLEERIAQRTADLVATNLQLTEEIKRRYLIEDQLQEKNLELAKALQAKDRFLANMSHELRTPLNAIIGFTCTLLMRLPGPLTEQQEKQLENIAVSARHLLSLINDLLDLSKIESGKVELNWEKISCASVLQEVAATVRPLAEEKGLALVVETPPHEIEIKSDRRALSQILLNFLNNAIKFTESGVVTASLQCSGGQVRFRVADTGIGIKPQDQDKLFKAFSQVGNVNSFWHEGAGLGLHLSKKLADLLAGAIEFSSQYGLGSEFTLVLKEAI